MYIRNIVSSILLTLTITAANAQSTAGKNQIPPDQKAFQDANRIADPAQRIEALQQFKKDFPDSPSVDGANSNILSTLVLKMPTEEARIRDFTQSMCDSASAQDKGRIAAQIADALLSGNLLLEDARKYAQIGLDSLDQDQYIANEKASYAKRKQKPPSKDELIKRFKTTRGQRLATLGRAEASLGHIEAAQKLLQEAYAVNPDAGLVTGALGDLAAKAGDNQKAMEYLVKARLSGRASAGAVEALKSVYRATHNGSLDGLEAMLDAEYNKRFPNPLHLDAYKPSKKRSDRLVLAEVFTGSGCPPCVGADLAFEAAMHRYARTDLAVVMYHQHIPQPDPMSNLDAQARSKYYNANGVPTYAIDGKTVAYFGAGRTGTKDVYNHIQPPIEKDLASAAEARIDLQAALAGNSVKVTASVDGVKGGNGNLKVQVLLVEKELRYIGENGIRLHPMVVRAMGGEKHDGFALAPGGATSFNQSWDLDRVSAGLKEQLDDYEAKGHRGRAFRFTEKKDEIGRGDLAVVAFVQDTRTKHVLQAALVDLQPEPGTNTSSDAAPGAK